MENECWVRACVYNKKGICQEPDRPVKIGCAATWCLTGKLPEKKGEEVGKTDNIHRTHG